MGHSVQSEIQKENMVTVTKSGSGSKYISRRTPPVQWALMLGGFAIIVVLISGNMYSFPASVLLIAVASIGGVNSSNVSEPVKACSALGASLQVSNAVVQFSSFVPAGTNITLSGGNTLLLTTF